MKTILTFFIPNFIVELFFQNTDNPNDFKLEIVFSWFSSDFVSFKYTANGGWTWHYIERAEEPSLGLFGLQWTYDRVAYSLGNGNFVGEKIKWGSYQLIKEYHAREWKKFKDGCVSIERELKEKEQRQKNALKKANT